MYTVTFNIDKCQACGDCVESCPIQILEMVEEDGKKFATFSDDPDECTGCLACEESCPEEAITLIEI